jgi:alkylation response protein AidB-like acyl-CoA dehydrogenase
MIDADTIAELRRSFAAALSCDDRAEARRQLIGAGWFEVLEEDDQAAIALVFTLQGATGRDVGALDDVLVRAAGIPAPDPDEIAVAYPVTPSEPAGGGPSHVLLAARARVRRVVWLPALGAQDVEIVEVAGDLDTRGVRGVDAAFGLVGLAAKPEGPSARLSGVGVVERWDDALAAGRIALAHQMIAGSRVLLAMASDYAAARRQFGSPIGSFQAVKHRLAEALVAISAADATVLAASTPRHSTGAAVAKATAARAAAVAGRNCLQVFGGIGFTSEHDFHRFFRRNIVLDRLLGDGRAIERELGARIRTGQLSPAQGVEIDDLPRLELLPSTNLGQPA